MFPPSHLQARIAEKTAHASERSTGLCPSRPSVFLQWLQATTAEETGPGDGRVYGMSRKPGASMRVMQAGFLMCCAAIHSSACR